jgi:hypothetical protein
MKTLIALLMTASVSYSSDLLGPIWDQQGNHTGDAKPLSWTIEYLDSWGRTVVDGSGGLFYHDRCCGGYQTTDPSWVYPQQYWGTYPMYYIGTTMRYRITLCNDTNRTYKNLRVIAIQEYFNSAGRVGERLGDDAAEDWNGAELKAGECVTLDGLFAIPNDGEGGLDQTHLQVQHWDKGRGQTGRGAVLVDETKAAIWCPPEKYGISLEQLGISGTSASGGGSVKITGGSRGFIQPAAGEPAAIAVTTVTPGFVTVRISDRSGALVRDLSGYAGGGRPEVFRWNGTDSAGNPVAPGIYLVTVDGPGLRVKDRIAVVR